jgi:multiple sugar transport system substrate-binding protein
MKKSTLVLMLAVILAVTAVVSGCSSSGGAGKTTEISWWAPNWDEATAKKLVEQFETENPDIKVNVVVTTWDTMENKIRVALTGKGAPAVITELQSRVKTYAAEKLLTNLDDNYKQAEIDKNDLFPSALDMNSYENSMYGVPFRIEGAGMLYNKKMFKDAGLDPDNFPKTWDEFIAAAKKLTKDTDGDGKIDQYGMAWPLGNMDNTTSVFATTLWSGGGNFFDESGKKALLNTPEAVEAVRKFTSTVKDGLAPRSTMELDNTTMRDLFINEKIAMYLSGPFDIEPIKTNKPSLELGTAVIPGPDGMGVSYSDGFSLIIPESAKNKEAGWKLIEFLSQSKNMAELTVTFPGLKSALDDPKFKDPLMQPFIEQMDKAQAWKKMAQWPEVVKTLNRYLQLIILEDQDVQQAMDKANAEIEAIVNK